MITLLNTSILTSFGSHVYEQIDLAEAKAMVTHNDWQSAIGHESTAWVISKLLSIDCPVNRISYIQQPGDIALVFKLNGRAQEGRIMSQDEIEAMGYTWGRLVRAS